ncbi:MAG: octaprenyl diphosphate synthase [Legionellales bacterium]|nr:octaprenyl diphosphate synthase [Legionellales bacterium]
MQFEQIQALVQPDLSAVQVQIQQCIDSPVGLIESVAHHLVDSGGKRLRPLLVILSARSLGYSNDEHIQAACAIELIHSATLLHDDVVDDSTQRRGKPTGNTIWGNAASILVGDYLYSQAFKLMTRLGESDQIMKRLADATTVIAQGEVKQLVNRHNPHLEEADYFEIITSKTAKLFEVSCVFGGLLAQASPSQLRALEVYGLQMGLAFQLIDDALDYRGDNALMGKNLGDDLAEGKATLPLIYAVAHAGEAERQLIVNSLKEGNRSDLDKINTAIVNCRALDYTLSKAKACIDEALSALNELPDSPYRQALTSVATFTIERAF